MKSTSMIVVFAMTKPMVRGDPGAFARSSVYEAERCAAGLLAAVRLWAVFTSATWEKA